ncbi:MAG TPA: hypothetical protein VMF63_06835 [Opitutaceae bacterium]|nr:hypothetical protein [Opitutaceae bacterium]
MLCLLVPGLLCASRLHAGPPFLTDDPEPVDLHHWEAYLFGTGDRTVDGSAVNGPAGEFNYGVLPDTQVHLVVPVTRVVPSGGGVTSGLGDTELGIKYRFVHENDTTPQIGVFPMAELPTGSADRGLGNGRAWFRLPVWLQKSRGPWTTYGGGGEALNSAPGQRDYPFGGWLVQRDFGPHLTLGGEIFSQGPDTVDGRGFTVANVGGYVNFTPGFSLLFSAGRSLGGERHTIWYLGLYWTGGPAEPVHP